MGAMTELDPAGQDLAPHEWETWELLTPEERARVMTAWRFFVAEDGESPIWLGWSMEIAGVLWRGRPWLPDDLSQMRWLQPSFTSRVSTELVPYGFRWPPVDDEGPAMVPVDVYSGLETALNWCEGDLFNWTLAAWFAREYGWWETAEWIEDHPCDYLLGVYQGFDFE